MFPPGGAARASPAHTRARPRDVADPRVCVNVCGRACACASGGVGWCARVSRPRGGHVRAAGLRGGRRTDSRSHGEAGHRPRPAHRPTGDYRQCTACPRAHPNNSRCCNSSRSSAGRIVGWRTNARSATNERQKNEKRGERPTMSKFAGQNQHKPDISL